MHMYFLHSDLLLYINRAYVSKQTNCLAEMNPVYPSKGYLAILTYLVRFGPPCCAKVTGQHNRTGTF